MRKNYYVSEIISARLHLETDIEMAVNCGHRGGGRWREQSVVNTPTIFMRGWGNHLHLPESLTLPLWTSPDVTLNIT